MKKYILVIGNGSYVLNDNYGMALFYEVLSNGIE
jgi:hypothetical protein